MNKSYESAEYSPDASEAERLRTQAMVMETEFDMVEDLLRLPRDGYFSILEVGCGPGHSTACIAKRWPNSGVIGLDHNPEFIKQAEETYGFEDNVEFGVADITQPAFLSFAYDLIMCRFVLQHIPRPLPVLNRLISQLRRAGKLLVIEADDYATAAANPALPHLFRAAASAHDQQWAIGGDRNVANKLEASLALKGIHYVSRQVRFTGLPQGSNGRDAAFSILSPAAMQHLLTDAQHEEYTKEYLELKADPYSFVTMVSKAIVIG